MAFCFISGTWALLTLIGSNDGGGLYYGVLRPVGIPFLGVFVTLLLPYTFLLYVLLFLVINEKAWNSKLFGDFIIKSNRSAIDLSMASIYVTRKIGEKHVYQNAFYLDNRLGDFVLNKTYARARLYEDEIHVRENRLWVPYSYSDMYKTFFWKYGVVLRIKTEHGPRDIFLRKCDDVDFVRLKEFLESKRPQHCSVFGLSFLPRKQQGPQNNYCYDLWEKRPRRIGKIVRFKALDEMHKH